MSHAHTLAPDHPPQLLSQLVSLGVHHLNRSQRLGELGDIEKTIEYMSSALALIPNDHPAFPSLLINLGMSYSLRYKRLGGLGDLEKAIESGTRVLALAPDDHPDLTSLLTNLGVSFRDRFKRLGELGDLESAIKHQSRAVALIPDDHPQLPFLYTNLGTSLNDRFGRLGELGDVERALESQSRALSLTHDNHPGLPFLLIGLGQSHSSRFERLGELDDLEKAMEYQSRAVALTPSSHSALPSRLMFLGFSCLNRFERLGGLGDLEKAIEYQSRAIALTPSDHPDLAPRLMNLGKSCRIRFQRLDQLGDLEKAIECQYRALALAPDDHQGLLSLFVNLGSSHAIRFKRLGELDDLEKAIEYLHRAVILTPGDDPDLPVWLMNLGVCYKGRFTRLGELGDLEKAINCHSRALALTPEGDSSLPRLLSNLGVAHGSRFERLGELGDLERAIQHQSRAVALTPSDHPSLPPWLMNLGKACRLRFERLSGLDDLEKAIGYLHSALALSPDGHPNLPSLLDNLRVAFSDRFHRVRKLDDLVKSSIYASRALALTPDGHPDLPKQYYGLARIEYCHYQCTGLSSHLKDSLHYFRKASQSLVGAPNGKFAVALEWAQLASKHSSLEPIEAYQTAIDLLPQYIWLGATTSQRYQDLENAKNLAVNAAAAAIRSSEYRLALEWLEHARCVVWNQKLMLRSPLDQLQASHPTLGARLRTVANQLDRASSESQASRELSSDESTPEQAAQQHRRLAGEYSDLLAQARKVPGFEDFLQPVKATSLIHAAQNGPIVVVTCSESKCDALLIPPEQDQVQHVPLPNFSHKKARNARTEIRNSLRCPGIRERGAQLDRDSEDECFEDILRTLWDTIVKPVLDSLGYTSKIPTGNLPHITWCPTGVLSFLPLHAAGDYDRPHSKVFDYAVSSYTPTLTALLTSCPTSLSPGCRVLGIGQEATFIPGYKLSKLPGTTKELEFMKEHTEKAHKLGFSGLIGSKATKAAVLDAMEQHDWVHLACHAHQNVEDPTKSGFFLHDGILDLASINKRSFKNKGLAFLSACQTATGDEKLPDEAVHLASGMLMAGYASVIATMWSVDDEDAPLVADKVYGQLMQDGKLENGQAGRALHNAVAELRGKVGEKEFGRWVPYIHIGS